MRVSVLIATYGSEEWAHLAQTRALPSAERNDPYDILIGHDPEGSISSVRNQLAEKAVGDWLCFLDADDELAPGYLGAMTRAFEQERGREALYDGILLTPALSYVKNGRRLLTHFQPELPLIEGNWLTIGTLIPKRMFERIGGFREWPLYEDWDLWARCDAPVVKVPEAVYLAHYSAKSRNRSARREARNYWHQMIGHDLWPDYYDSPTGAEHALREVMGVRKLVAA